AAQERRWALTVDAVERMERREAALRVDAEERAEVAGGAASAGRPVNRAVAPFDQPAERMRAEVRVERVDDREAADGVEPERGPAGVVGPAAQGGAVDEAVQPVDHRRLDLHSVRRGESVELRVLGAVGRDAV